MKTFFYAAISVFLLASCTDITRKDIDISSIPILHEKFNIHNIDSTKTSNPQLSSSASFLRLNVLSSLN